MVAVEHLPSNPEFAAERISTGEVQESPGRFLQLLLSSVAVFAVTFAATALGPIQETMRMELALSDNQVALLQGPARALALIIGGIPMGILVDRYSRTRLLVACAVFSVVAHVCTALVTSFSSLFVARFMVGLSGALTLTASISLIADLYSPTKRGRALMLMGIFQVGGASAAFALGGLLVDLLGSGPDSWRLVMMWLTFPLVAVILALLGAREPARMDVKLERPSVQQALVELWSFRKLIIPLLGGVVIVDVAFGGGYIWAAPVLSRDFGISPARVGGIMSLVLLVGGILGPATSGVLADLGQRAGGPRRTIGILTVLSILTVPAGLFSVAPTASSAILALVVLLTLLPAISLMVTTVLTVIIPNELRGLGTSVLNAASVTFAYFLAPPAVSLLSSALGGPSMLGKSVALVCVTTCIFGACTFALGVRHFPRADRALRA